MKIREQEAKTAFQILNTKIKLTITSPSERTHWPEAIQIKLMKMVFCKTIHINLEKDQGRGISSIKAGIKFHLIMTANIQIQSN